MTVKIIFIHNPLYAILLNINNSLIETKAPRIFKKNKPNGESYPCSINKTEAVDKCLVIKLVSFDLRLANKDSIFLSIYLYFIDFCCPHAIAPYLESILCCFPFYLVLHFSTINSPQSQSDKKEAPTKRLRAPPRSAMKEMVEKAQASVSTRMSVVAKL